MPVSSYVSDAAQDRYDAWRTTAPEDGPSPTEDERLDALHEILLDVDRDGESVGQIADLIDRDGLMPLVRAVLAIDGPDPAAIGAALKIIADDIKLSLDVVAQREAERMMLERIELAKDDDNRE